MVNALLFRPDLYALEIAPQPSENSRSFTQKEALYHIPELTVVDQKGKKLTFSEALNDGRPVILSFIFASCSAVCPMLSQTLAKTQALLDKQITDYHIVSMSIDPENDTPAILADYAKKFKANAHWDFYTGSVETSIAIQKAFETYRGDKMNHSSVLLLRSAPGQPWLRLEGFFSPQPVVEALNQTSKY